MGYEAWTELLKQQEKRKEKKSGLEVGGVIYELLDLFTFIICEVSRWFFRALPIYSKIVDYQIVLSSTSTYPFLPPPHRLSSYKLQSSKLPSYALLIYSFPQTPSYNLPSIFSYMHLSRLPSCSLSPNTLPSYTLSSFSLPSHTRPSCNLSPHTLPFYTLLSYTLPFPHHFTL